jgi:hypothetical protein
MSRVCRAAFNVPLRTLDRFETACGTPNRGVG